MTLNFCKECFSLRYPVNKNGVQYYSCRNCATTGVERNPLVSRIVQKGEKNVHKAIHNPNLILDPTLPHMAGVICPKCNTKDPVYFQTTEDDMTLTYVCTNKDCTHMGQLSDFDTYH